MPADQRHQLCADHAAEGGTEGEPAKHQGYQRPAPPGRQIFRGHGDGIRHCAAEAEAGQKTQEHQHLQIGGKRGKQAEQAEQGDAKLNHPFAAKAVGERAAEQRPGGQAQQSRAK